MKKPTTRGKNISHLQLTLLGEMDGDDATTLMAKIEQLMHVKDLSGFENLTGLRYKVKMFF